MTGVIPANAPDIDAKSADDQRSREELEHEILQLDAKIKRLASKEAGQRHAIRWIAVVTGLVVIATMLGVLGHTLHRLNWWPLLRPSTPFMVAIVVAPITSISAITIALFIGAFRKFEDKDAENAASGLSVGANLFSRGS